jgi:hypothetical protein
MKILIGGQVVIFVEKRISFVLNLPRLLTTTTTIFQQPSARKFNSQRDDGSGWGVVKVETRKAAKRQREG